MGSPETVVVFKGESSGGRSWGGKPCRFLSLTEVFLGIRIWLCNEQMMNSRSLWFTNDLSRVCMSIEGGDWLFEEQIDSTC